MKKFTIPFTYRSKLISAVKQNRQQADKMKKDFTPTLLDFGNLKIYLARHFGFCYGVENAIEIAFKTIEENPGKRIFLLSEMIHNPVVNHDLKQLGVQFLQNTQGKQVIDFDTLTSDDIVLIPAFGTTIPIENKLKAIGINIEKFNTTCPFVEKVWNRSEQIAKKEYTVIVHGKPTHEETRATFSHAAKNTATIVINDMKEAILLGSFITGEKSPAEFYKAFEGRLSTHFNFENDLKRIGVVNQTTMLASDTQAIADYLKNIMIEKFGLTAETLSERFADTKDTLCYATNDNQSAIYGLLKEPADVSIIVGGYNSSNTSHLVELTEPIVPTYFINGSDKIISKNEILHFDLHKKEEIKTTHYLPEKETVKILLSSGASCPDAIVEQVINKLAMLYNSNKQASDLVANFI